MSVRLLPSPVHAQLPTWSQIEFGLLAAMCALGYASALALALT